MEPGMAWLGKARQDAMRLDRARQDKELYD
jgi:hypothetical protein